MIPPDWLCESCGFIVTASGSSPRACPRCGKSSFSCIGNRPGYNPEIIQAPYQIQSPSSLTPSNSLFSSDGHDIICARCGFLYANFPITPNECGQCGGKSLISLGSSRNYNLSEIRQKYPEKPELRKQTFKPLNEGLIRKTEE